jgi:hypothetical protein
LVTGSAGFIGINTSTPNYPLHVYKSSGTSAINVESVKKEMKDNEGTYSTLVLVIYENNYLFSDKAEIIAMWNVKS